MGPSGPSATTPSTGPAHAQEALRITAFGPRGLNASERFYPQASGEVAMWVELNRPIPHADAAIWLGGQRLRHARVEQKIVTGAVSESLALPPGVYRLQVRWGGDGDQWQGATPEVDFVVEHGYGWGR